MVLCLRDRYQPISRSAFFWHILVPCISPSARKSFRNRPLGRPVRHAISGAWTSIIVDVRIWLPVVDHQGTSSANGRSVQTAQEWEPLHIQCQSINAARPSE